MHDKSHLIYDCQYTRPNSRANSFKSIRKKCLTVDVPCKQIEPMIWRVVATIRTIRSAKQDQPNKIPFCLQ